MIGNNSSVVWVGDQPVRVEQGPAVLVEVLYDPPSWAWTALLVVAVVVIVWAGYAAATVELTPAVKWEIVENVGIAVMTAGVTLVLVQFAPLPYVLDVLGGVAVGYLSVWLSIPLIRAQVSKRKLT